MLVSNDGIRLSCHRNDDTRNSFIKIMRNIIIQERQTIFDIALQYCGDVEAAFQIIDITDISLTETLSACMELTVPAVINQRIVDYYENNSISPATGETEEENLSVLVTDDGEPLVNENYSKYLIEDNNG